MFVLVRKVCHLKVICIKITFHGLLRRRIVYFMISEDTFPKISVTNAVFSTYYCFFSPSFHVSTFYFIFPAFVKILLFFFFLSWIFFFSYPQVNTIKSGMLCLFPEGSHWQQLSWTHNGIFWGQEALCMKPLLQIVQQQHWCKAQCILLMTKLHGWLLWRECRHPAW